MKKSAWKRKIVSAMKDTGTYRDAYLPVADTLADILERRDMALEQWTEQGCLLTVQKTSDRGAVNTAKNPLLTILQECEKDALTYWSQLGLTPSGLRKSFSDDKERAKQSPLALALMSDNGKRA